MHQTPPLGLILGAGLLLGASQALAATPAPDKSFAMKAAQGGLAEVQDGQLAAQKATSPLVKQFGQRMVTDHSQANDELQQIAEQQNLTLPTQPGATQQATDRRLRAMAGADFDTAYMNHAVQDHQQDVAAFQREAQSGKDPALKAFAQKYLPIIRTHLQLAQTVSARR